ncbi:MAG: HAD family hydrolase [Candidatus Shapirobacteria bacterium]
MKKNKIIFFDFDGVIVNSCQMSFEINKESIVDIEYSEIQKWGEGNVYNSKLRETFNDDHIRYYFEQYEQRVKEILPVEGMEEVFKKLISIGYRLVIVSSADEKAIEIFLKKYSLDKYFIEILARRAHTSKVEKFKMAFGKYKIKAKETLLVTDSVGDIKEAHEVKMKAIGVIWGLHEKERLEKNGADFIAEKPEDIIIGVKKILALN